MCSLQFKAYNLWVYLFAEKYKVRFHLILIRFRFSSIVVFTI